MKAKPKLLIIGKSGSGKDLVCDYLVKCHGFRYTAPTPYISEVFIYKAMAALGHNYVNPEACYADRRNHMILWKTLIAAYNVSTVSGVRLFDEVMQTSDIYNGIRKRDEFLKVRDSVDAVIWVGDGWRKRPVPDGALELVRHDADYAIENKGTVVDMKAEVDEVLNSIKEEESKDE